MNREARNWNLPRENPLVISIDDNLVDYDYGTRIRTFDNRLPWMAFKYYRHGDLHSFIGVDDEPLSYDVIKTISIDVLYGLEMFHSRHLAYNDLKPENIILSKRPTLSEVRVKLADFGLVSDSNEKLSGTLYTMAPEKLLPDLGFEIDIFKADIWSFGIVLYMLKTKRKLFDDADENYFLQLLKASYQELRMSFPRKIWKYSSDFQSYSINQLTGCKEESNYYAEMCHINGQDEHCFCDLLLNSLRYNPGNRISASEALDHKFFLSLRYE